MSNGGWHKYGYKFNADTGKYEVEPSEALVVKHLYMYIHLGYSVSESADIINTMGIRRPDGQKFDSLWIKRNLSNSRYIGEDGFPKIVSENIFKFCQAYFKNVVKSRRRINRKAYMKRKNGAYDDVIEYIVLDDDLKNFI